LIYQLADTTINSIPDHGEAGRILVQPNPATGKVRITLPGKELINSTLNILDMEGRTLFSYEPGSVSSWIDLGFLQPGIYFLITEHDRSPLSAKLVIY
jgi:hypothetical protein